MSRPPEDPWRRHRQSPYEEYPDEEYADEAYLPGQPAPYQASDPHGGHDESLAADVLEAPEEEYLATRRSRRRRPRRRHRWVPLVIAAVLVVIGSIVGLRALEGLLPDLEFSSAPQDYEGQGSGEVMVEIPQGAGGGQIGEILAEHDVVASSEAFSVLAAADQRATSIQPGTYRMAEQMSAAAALERLLDSEYREVVRVTVREGLWVPEVFSALAEGTGHSVKDYKAVDPRELDLPDAAEGELEGFLFPETYSFSPNAGPAEQLQEMVDHGVERFEALGIPDDELRRTVIVASLVQGEGMFAEDLPKIARVVENRLEQSEPLGFDSTIHYIAQERGRAGTTDEQRNVDSPYNTYRNTGLPPGPINSPGDDALAAALDPAEGDWMFFVTVDPDSGETLFAETYEEHLENQKEFQRWCRENPDRC